MEYWCDVNEILKPLFKKPPLIAPSQISPQIRINIAKRQRGGVHKLQNAVSGRKKFGFWRFIDFSDAKIAKNPWNFGDFHAFFAKNKRLVLSTTRSSDLELGTVGKLFLQAFQRHQARCRKFPLCRMRAGTSSLKAQFWWWIFNFFFFGVCRDATVKQT